MAYFLIHCLWSIYRSMVLCCLSCFYLIYFVIPRTDSARVTLLAESSTYYVFFSAIAVVLLLCDSIPLIGDLTSTSVGSFHALSLTRSFL